MPESLPRLITTIPFIDAWIEQILSAIERALNINASPPLSAVVTPTGVRLAFLPQAIVAHAETGGGGIAAMTGTTPGSATVTLFDYSGGATYASQTITETAYNFGSSAVGANKRIIMIRVDNRWVSIWEDCAV